MVGPVTSSRMGKDAMEMCTPSSVLLPRGTSLSSVAALSNGGSRTSNVRAVVRLRPASENEKHWRTCLFPLENEGSGANDVFATPAKTSVQRRNIQTSATPLIRNTISNTRKSSSSTAQNPFASVTNVNGYATSMVATKGDVLKEYVYDAVFAPEATQKEVYDRSVGDAVRCNIFQGYNTTIIAYGQSGSGKTYTMSGQKETDKMAASPLGSSFAESFNFDEAVKQDCKLSDDDGIIPRAVHDLFEAKQHCESVGEVSITLTYLEIYNEELRDLLADEQLGESSLKIRDSAEGGSFVYGLTTVPVTSVEHARELIDAATTRRRTASTKLNERSSRSHAICTLGISISSAMNSQTNYVDTIDGHGSKIITAKLTMVDLSGSERIKQSRVTGITQKENININKDLFVLAKVVSALSQNAKKKTHVPYRDSKLTRLLRDSLGGNCCTVVVACVSPSDLCFEESIKTLRYAERTRTITNSIEQNVTKAALVPTAVLREENKVLKTKLLELKKHVRLLEGTGGQKGLHTNMSLEDSRGSYDLYATLSGETTGSTVNSSSSFERRLDLDTGEKKATLERLNRKLLESKLMLSKDSLMDRSTEEYAVQIESSMSDTSAIENRISRSLKYENDGLRKQHKELEDSIRSMEAEMKSLAATVSKRKAQFQEEIAQMEIRYDILRRDVRLMEERQARASYQNPRFASMAQATATGGQMIELSLMSSKPKMNASANTELDQMRDTLKTTKQELEKNKTELNTSSTRVLKLENTESILRKQVDEMHKDKIHDRKYRDQSISDLETLIKETKKLTKERDQALIQVAINKDAERKIEGTVQTKDTLIAELRRELNEARENLFQLKNSRAAATSEAAPMEQDLEDTVSVAAESLNSALTDDPIFSNKTGSIADDGSSTYTDIRVHAAKMLFYANRAIEKGRSSRTGSVASSFASSNATDFKPDVRHLQTISKPSGATTTGKPPRSSKSDAVENQVVISNMDHVAIRTNACACQNSLFSGNADHAEFYLPKLGMACTCEKHKHETSTLDGVDPTSLGNILRPWQVKFLKSLNIVNGVELVHAYNQREGELSKAMRKWRREQKLPSVKTKSCHIALRIWSRTCKAVVRSVRKQQAEGAKIFRRPDFLEVSSDTRTISTLGCGSMIDLQSEMMEV